MDSIDPLAVTRPSIPNLSASASLKLKGPRRTRTQTTAKCAASRDEKPRKASPLPPRALPSKPSHTAAKNTTTRWISRTFTPGSSAISKPLLPLSESRCPSDKRGTDLRTETDSETVEIAPEGTSAGRTGRQFAVSNVGNNGRIYLRYGFVLTPWPSCLSASTIWGSRDRGATSHEYQYMCLKNEKEKKGEKG